MFYAVKNRNTGKYVTGTDFSRGKPRQIMAKDRPPLILGDCGIEGVEREISRKRYKIVPVEVREIERQRQQAEPERKPLPAGYYNMARGLGV